MAILLAFLVSAQNATALTKARTALSPYFQTDADSTYTFIGISHPSLAGAATTIGLAIATKSVVGSAVTSSFTVQAGETYRIFIARCRSFISTGVSTQNKVFLACFQVKIVITIGKIISRVCGSISSTSYTRFIT